MTSVFDRFRPAIESLDLAHGLTDWPEPLLMRRDGDWATYYAPFDHVNTRARVVLVGITPGLQQVGNALRALQQELRRGTPEPRALEIAKGFASFSGPMRQNLIDLLDAIGLPRLLGIDSAAQLFGDRADLVHYTSALRYPVTLKGENYGGSPGIASARYPREELRWFTEEAAELSQGVFVPLGPAVTEALEMLARTGAVSASRVLAGLPHPSGANAERIAYFTGRKPREALSKKTDPDKLDRARAALLDRVSRPASPLAPLSAYIRTPSGRNVLTTVGRRICIRFPTRRVPPPAGATEGDLGMTDWLVYHSQKTMGHSYASQARHAVYSRSNNASSASATGSGWWKARPTSRPAIRSWIASSTRIWNTRPSERPTTVLRSTSLARSFGWQRRLGSRWLKTGRLTSATAFSPSSASS